MSEKTSTTRATTGRRTTPRCLEGPLWVEGPGDQRFELSDVPLATRVGEIAAELLPVARAAAGGTATVYLLRRGALPRGLAVDATLEQVGLRAGDHLRLVATPPTACLARLYRAGDAARADALRAGMPAKTVPLALDPERAVERVLHQLARRGALPELFVLAALRWPEDDQLRRAVSMLAAAAAHPREVAPRAWIGMKGADQEAVLELWQRSSSQPRPPSTP